MSKLLFLGAVLLTLALAAVPAEALLAEDGWVEAPANFIVKAGSPTRSSMILTWTAPAYQPWDVVIDVKAAGAGIEVPIGVPGDGPIAEPPIGTFGERVQAYDLRWSLSSILDETFDLATQVPNEPVPSNPGSPESCLVTGLPSGRPIHFAIRAVAANGLVSLLSTTSGETLDDTLPPAQITGLGVIGLSESSATLAWTAPADDDGSQVGGYDLRYSTTPIVDAATWAAATPADGEPLPLAPGLPESMRISGLESGITYHVAVVAIDAGGLSGPRSASVAATIPADDGSSAGGASPCSGSAGPGSLLAALLLLGLIRLR